jgi:FKBP-type peptidyl-prolyl cis-trans isomerase
MKLNNSNNLPFLQNKFKTNMKRWTNLFFLIALIVTLASCNTKDPNEQVNKEYAAIDTYLNEHNTDPVVIDGLGTRIVIKSYGDDAPPHGGQNVQVSYQASIFPDGKVFDINTIDDKIDNISIPGLQSALAIILKGTHAVLYIPSKYAFGSTGTAAVPPNTTVVYEITLDKVTKTDAEQAQFQLDTAAIHSYIKDPKNKVDTTATMLPSGVWYTMQTEGTGTQAAPYSTVSINYTGTLLSNGSQFSNGSLTQQSIFSFIDGLKLGIPLMKEGGKATFYIPSIYGFGPKGNGGVGGNQNLIFDIGLNAVSSLN